MSNLKLKKSNFIHIPKCAGTFAQAILYKLDLVKEAYSKPNNGHLFFNQTPNIETHFNFCFVRHPYTWWPSFWQWSKRDRFSDMEKECDDFDTWVKEYGPFWMGQYTRLVQRYTGEDPLFNNTTARINFVGKVENFFPDLHEALILAGEEFEKNKFEKIRKEYKTDLDIFPHINAQKYKQDISFESRKIIYKTERYIFDKFNYEL